MPITQSSGKLESLPDDYRELSDENLFEVTHDGMRPQARIAGDPAEAKSLTKAAARRVGAGLIQGTGHAAALAADLSQLPVAATMGAVDYGNNEDMFEPMQNKEREPAQASSLQMPQTITMSQHGMEQGLSMPMRPNMYSAEEEVEQMPQKEEGQERVVDLLKFYGKVGNTPEGMEMLQELVQGDDFAELLLNKHSQAIENEDGSISRELKYHENMTLGEEPVNKDVRIGKSLSGHIQGGVKKINDALGLTITEDEWNSYTPDERKFLISIEVGAELFGTFGAIGGAGKLISMVKNITGQIPKKFAKKADDVAKDATEEVAEGLTVTQKAKNAAKAVGSKAKGAAPYVLPTALGTYGVYTGDPFDLDNMKMRGYVGQGVGGLPHLMHKLIFQNYAKLAKDRLKKKSEQEMKKGVEELDRHYRNIHRENKVTADEAVLGAQGLRYKQSQNTEMPQEYKNTFGLNKEGKVAMSDTSLSSMLTMGEESKFNQFIRDTARSLPKHRKAILAKIEDAKSGLKRKENEMVADLEDQVSHGDSTYNTGGIQVPYRDIRDKSKNLADHIRTNYNKAKNGFREEYEDVIAEGHKVAASGIQREKVGELAVFKKLTSKRIDEYIKKLDAHNTDPYNMHSFNKNVDNVVHSIQNILHRQKMGDYVTLGHLFHLYRGLNRVKAKEQYGYDKKKIDGLLGRTRNVIEKTAERNGNKDIADRFFDINTRFREFMQTYRGRQLGDMHHHRDVIDDTYHGEFVNKMLVKGKINFNEYESMKKAAHGKESEVDDLLFSHMQKEIQRSGEINPREIEKFVERNHVFFSESDTRPLMDKLWAETGASQWQNIAKANPIDFHRKIDQMKDNSFNGLLKASGTAGADQKAAAKYLTSKYMYSVMQMNHTNRLNHLTKPKSKQRIIRMFEKEGLEDDAAIELYERHVAFARAQKDLNKDLMNPRASVEGGLAAKIQEVGEFTQQNLGVKGTTIGSTIRQLMLRFYANFTVFTFSWLPAGAQTKVNARILNELFDLTYSDRLFAEKVFDGALNLMKGHGQTADRLFAASMINLVSNQPELIGTNEEIFRREFKNLYGVDPEDVKK